MDTEQPAVARVRVEPFQVVGLRRKLLQTLVDIEKSQLPAHRIASAWLLLREIKTSSTSPGFWRRPGGRSRSFAPAPRRAHGFELLPGRSSRGALLPYRGRPGTAAKDRI